MVLAHDWQRARRGLSRYLRWHPDDGEALLLLGSVCRELGDYSGALDALRRVPGQSSVKPYALFEEGELHWAHKRAGEAERCWRKALELDRTSARPSGDRHPSELTLWALGRLADLYLLQSRDDEARHVLWILFDSMPKSDAAAVDLLLRLTAIELEEENPKNAITELKPCAAAEPENFNVKSALMLYYLRAGMPEKAAELAGQLARHAAEDAHVWECLARYFLKTGDSTGLSRLLQKMPPQPKYALARWRSRVLTYRGIDRENHGQLQQALDCYRRAVAACRRNREANARLAEALRLTGQRSEFKQQIAFVKRTADYVSKLSQYLGRLPKFPGNTLGADQCQELARLCESLTWQREAIAWYQLALARNPNLPESKATLHRLQTRRESGE